MIKCLRALVALWFCLSSSAVAQVCPEEVASSAGKTFDRFNWDDDVAPGTDDGGGDDHVCVSNSNRANSLGGATDHADAAEGTCSNSNHDEDVRIDGGDGGSEHSHQSSTSVEADSMKTHKTSAADKSESCDAATIVWDMVEDFGATVQDAKPATDAAIAAAKKVFKAFPDATVVLRYPAGTFFFLGAKPSIDLGRAGIKPGKLGRLIFEGAGKKRTKMVTKQPEATAIRGLNVYRVTFRGLHFARDYITVTQGSVVSANSTSVTLDLHEGFPAPDSLWTIPGAGLQQGKWLRRYTDDPLAPEMVQCNNKQVRWDPTKTVEVSPGRWRFAFYHGHTSSAYKEGDIVGVKCKSGGQAYWFCGGDDIAFEDCRWTHKTRGIFRGGINNVRITGCDAVRLPAVAGRVPCLASPGGGPQIGHPSSGDPRISGISVEDCTFDACGDDNLALFKVDEGIVRNILTQDSFARNILLYLSPEVQLCHNTVIRGPIQGDYRACKEECACDSTQA